MPFYRHHKWRTQPEFSSLSLDAWTKFNRFFPGVLLGIGAYLGVCVFKRYGLGLSYIYEGNYRIPWARYLGIDNGQVSEHEIQYERYELGGEGPLIFDDDLHASKHEAHHYVGPVEWSWSRSPLPFQARGPHAAAHHHHHHPTAAVPVADVAHGH